MEQFKLFSTTAPSEKFPYAVFYHVVKCQLEIYCFSIESQRLFITL